MSTPAPAASAISSPCIGVCTIENADELRGRPALCLGCGRTLDEIVAWGGLDEARRRAVMAELPHRLAADGLAADGLAADGLAADRRPALDAGARHP